MGEERHGWKWRQKAALAAVLLLITLVAALLGLRKPWIKPLPGVRVELTRPFVKESDLGPESAYRLLLQAVQLPAEAEQEAGSARIWQDDYSDAQTKFDLHGWPAKPPQPAPEPEAVSEELEEEEEEDPMFGPLETDGGDMFGPKPGLPANHRALATDAPWTLEQYEDILRLLELLEPNIAILDQALAAPDPQVPTADSYAFELPYLSPTRALARWLSVSAQYRAATGDCAGSCRDLERILDMANVICRGGSLINHLVGVACDAIAANAAWGIATREGLPAPLLTQMAQSFLAHADGAEPYVEAIRAEVPAMIDAVPKIYRQGNLNALGGGHYGPPGLFGRLAFSFAFLVGSTPQATTRNLKACYQHLVAIAEKPYSAAVQGEYSTFMSELLGIGRDPKKLVLEVRDPLGCILASMLLPALDRAHTKAAHRDAALRGMALLLAIQAYEKEHGALPEKLAQLVPDYLPRVPKDPFDGKPFRYLRSGVQGLPPKAWAIYSIGEDFTDDGGEARSVGQARKKRIVNPDLVWPSQAYPPESPTEP